MLSNVWIQNYNPTGNIWLSAFIAIIPIIFFLVTLGALGWKGHVAGFWTAILALALAVVFFKMPISKGAISLVYGFFYGMWPISWIIVAAVFLYKLSVNSGQFDIIRDSILSITQDQRILVILIGFCFGAFLEGAAGFGAPVAITAALLVGIGLKPLYAAGLCMVANTAPVAFGALGVPITVGAQVSGIDANLMGQMAGRQLPLLSFFIPLFLVYLMDKKRGLKEVWPAALVAGSSFAITQFLSASFLGPQLPDIVSAIVSLLATALFLRVWKPSHVYTVEEAQRETGESVHADAIEKLKHHSAGSVVRAWAPFILLVIFVIVWTNGAFKALFAKGGALAWAVIQIKMPGLHQGIQQSQPIGGALQTAILKIDLINATGTAIFLAAIVTVFVYGMSRKEAVNTFKETIKEMKWALVSIGCVLAFAYIMNYSGMAVTMALALAKTGGLFPFVSPVIGWIGVFLTGSDTSSNALFCNLQAITANQINIPQVLLVAANSTGGVTGKMISPQSISIACAAVGMVGQESKLLRFTLKYSIIFLFIICLMTGLQAYVFPWMISGN